MNRLIFANQLRGVAALSVAVSHLVGVYWAMQDFVALATAAPAQGGAIPPIFAIVSFTWFNYGPFGVGVFFLISGLVIPISLAQHTRLSFLAARVLRIYPTYVAALLIEMAVLYAASLYWHQIFYQTPWSITMNALLIYNYVDAGSADLVNWTLAVELKFYLLMMLAAPWIRRGSLACVFAVAAALLATTLAIHHWWPGVEWMRQFTIEAVYLIFMLIGVVFHFRLRGTLGLPAFLAAVTTLCGVMVLCQWNSIIAEQYPVVTVNYGYALILFGALFALRRFARPFPPLDYLAAISFPFYLVHSLMGYEVMKLLMIRLHVAYLPSLTAAFVFDAALATVLHRLIELPTSAMGRKLARRDDSGMTRRVAAPTQA